jgi:hypothetical protein
MKYISIYMCLFAIILVVNSFNCRPNCQTCEIINTLDQNISVCIKCNNENWGNLCQNLCHCQFACDIDTGECITMTKNTSIEVKSIGHIFLLIIVLCAISFGLYHLAKYIQQQRQRNKVHYII